MTVRLSKSKSPLGKRFLRAVTKYWQLYLLFLPVLAWYIIFCYMPIPQVFGHSRYCGQPLGGLG